MSFKLKVCLIQHNFNNFEITLFSGTTAFFNFSVTCCVPVGKTGDSIRNRNDAHFQSAEFTLINLFITFIIVNIYEFMFK